MPELSVAVGSVHVILIELIPIGMVISSGSGQLLINGGIVSSPAAVLEENMVN